MSELTPTQRAFLAEQRMTETFSDFSAHDLATMPMDEYARLTGRKLAIESAAPQQAHPGQGSRPLAWCTDLEPARRVAVS